MRDLFCLLLNWGKSAGAMQMVPVGALINQTLTAKPVAQLGALPVFRIDWPDTKPPNVTQRRAVYHKLSQNVSATLVADRLNAAFDVEAVAREFFTSYSKAFKAAERLITGIDNEPRRLFTQKLFNRLIFIIFLERKGWLTFDGHRDYLRALWEAHLKERQADPQTNFYTDLLKLLFFAGLNTPREVNFVDINHGGVLANRIGQVAYLNAGPFEEEADDKNDAICEPDDVLDEALTDHIAWLRLWLSLVVDAGHADRRRWNMVHHSRFCMRLAYGAGRPQEVRQAVVE